MNQGKIYADSADLYHDQARLAFDYYRKAAEQIVGEELRIEKELASAEALMAHLTTQIGSLKPLIAGAYGLAALSLLLYFQIGLLALIPALALAGYGAYVQFVKSANLAAQAAEQQSIWQNLRSAHDAIRRDYKIQKMGVAYVPVAREIPFEGKSFLIDLTDSTERRQFRLSSLRQAELFTSTIAELEELLREAPIVEGASDTEEVPTDQYSLSIQKITYYDFLGSLDRKLRTLVFCLEDLDTTAVDLPTIAPASDLSRYLKLHGASDPGGAPVLNAFNVSRFDADLDTFRSLNNMKKSLERHSSQFEDGLKRLMLDLAHAVQSLTKRKTATANMLIGESNRLLFTILKAPYNHYSPKLEHQEIERIRQETFNYQDAVENYKPFQLKPSSRVRYDLLADTWVAEDGSQTKSPFGMNAIQEEIIAPIVQNLMSETRLARLDIYNSIKDQKRDYLNQWHRDTEDFYGRNRAESNNLINLMRSTFSEFVANYNALSGYERTEKNMVESGSIAAGAATSEGNELETIAGYDLKSREFQALQEEFSAYMERLKEDIDRRAERFGYIEYFDASLRDAGAKSFADAAESAAGIESRRKPLLAVNPHFAAHSELPPVLTIDAAAHENLALNLEEFARAALRGLDLPGAGSTNGPPSPAFLAGTAVQPQSDAAPVA